MATVYKSLWGAKVVLMYLDPRANTWRGRQLAVRVRSSFVGSYGGRAVSI